VAFVDQILSSDVTDKGMRLAGKIDKNLVCHIDRIISNDEDEKRLWVETSAPLKWRFGVGPENPKHKNILTKREFNELSVYHDK